MVALAAGAVYRTVPISNSSLFFLHCIKNETSFMDVSFLWQAAPFKITMISPVFSRVSAIFGNPFPSWRGVLLDGHCATQKDIA